MKKFTKVEEAIMQEAFITGRIYSQTGEKEKPCEIQEKLKENCSNVVLRMINAQQKTQASPVPSGRA